MSDLHDPNLRHGMEDMSHAVAILTTNKSVPAYNGRCGRGDLCSLIDRATATAV